MLRCCKLWQEPELAASPSIAAGSQNPLMDLLFSARPAFIWDHARRTVSWMNAAARTAFGLSAQELQEALPAALIRRFAQCFEGAGKTPRTAKVKAGSQPALDCSLDAIELAGGSQGLIVAKIGGECTAGAGMPRPGAATKADSKKLPGSPLTPSPSPARGEGSPAVPAERASPSPPAGEGTGVRGLPAARTAHGRCERRGRDGTQVAVPVPKPDTTTPAAKKQPGGKRKLAAVLQLTPEEIRSFKAIGRTVRRLADQKCRAAAAPLPAPAGTKLSQPAKAGSAAQTAANPLFAAFDLVLLLGENFEIVDSAGRPARFGHRKAALPGKPAAEIFLPSGQAQFRRMARKLEGTAQTARGTLPVAGAGGNSLPCRAILGRWGDGSAKYFLALISLATPARLEKPAARLPHAPAARLAA